MDANDLLPVAHYRINLERSMRFGLTARERDVLMGIATGQSTAEIAIALSSPETTVRTHIGSMERKVLARTRAHAIARALEIGILEVLDDSRPQN